MMNPIGGLRIISILVIFVAITLAHGSRASALEERDEGLLRGLLPEGKSDSREIRMFYPSLSPSSSRSGDAAKEPIIRIRHQPQFKYGHQRNPLLENRRQKPEMPVRPGLILRSESPARTVNYHNPPVAPIVPLKKPPPPPKREERSPAFSGSSKVGYGIASWYGGKFHGRRTSNGEIYNMYKCTAAHRRLPFDTYLQVTNLRNGRSTIVRINDRGPFIPGREIDLSYRAAAELDMVDTGVERVRMEIIGNWAYKHLIP